MDWPSSSAAPPPGPVVPAGPALLTPAPGVLAVARPQARRHGAWLLAAWCAMAAYAAWRCAQGPGGGGRGLVADLVFLPFYPAAGLACASAARVASGRARQGLSAIAAAWFLSCAGELLYLAALAAPTAAPWLQAAGDGLDAVYYPLTALGFLLLSRRPSRGGERLRLAADALVAAAAAGTLAWYFVARHLGPEEPWLANLESVLGSGAGEVVILLAAATALARPVDGVTGPALHALAGGALALALGDLASAQHALAEADGTSLAGDLFLVLGTVLSATGGLLGAWPGGRAAIPRPLEAALGPLHRMPVLAVASVLVLLARELLSGPMGAMGGLAAATAGFAVLVMVRLQLTERALAQEAAARIERDRALQQAQKLEMLGLLAGGVAHDFANLLASLGGLSGALRERLAADAGELDELDEAVVRGRALCRRLLALGRREPAPIADLDARDLVDELLPFLRRLLPSGMELHAAGAHQEARVRVERAQLELALMNLVVNARDAMPAGGRIWLRVGRAVVAPLGALARRGVPAGPWVKLSVVDSGTGMDEETLRRALEPFFTTKPEGVGTGLGLATVRAMVEAASGHLLIDSAPGRGTVVTILLPPAGPAGNA